MLEQRGRHGADVVQMLFKCFVFAGYCDRDVNNVGLFMYTLTKLCDPLTGTGKCNDLPK